MASTASIQLRLHKSNTSPAPPRRTQSAEVAQSELLSPHTATGSRSSSPDVQLARPTTATSRASVSSTSSTQGTKEKKKKKAWNWLGHHKDKDEPDNSPAFWVSGHRDKVPYDVEDLLNARPVPEIWDPSGDCLVYLFPEDSGRDPSFRVKSSIFTSSHRLYTLAKNSETPSTTSDRDSFAHTTYERHLYIPVDRDGSEQPLATGPGVSAEAAALLRVRNLFAFLMGRSLIATRYCPTTFDIFTDLSHLLKLYDFSNVDGSTFGDVPTLSFDAYVDEYELADIRDSHEKTIEAIILGERMKNVKLYNEAFTHAAGKHDALVKANDPKFNSISPITINRLSRAAMNLDRNIATVHRTMEDLDFASIFSGVMATKRKHIDFDQWRESFFATRKFFMHFYKQRYKAWPPKPISKHGIGLNRVVLQDMYQDLCSVYDLLVDRSHPNLTAAGGDTTGGDAAKDESKEDPDADPRPDTLREVLSEYNRSSPPVKPTIPFDIPMIPTRADVDPKDAKAMSKKLKDDEIVKILEASHNQDAVSTQFAEAFSEMDRKSARHKNVNQIADHRMGQWIFIHAILQVLPIVVVDAPDIYHTKDVEYFLCEPPKSGVPWAREEAMRNSSPLMGGVPRPLVARLPADLLESGTEGLFRRSHCWTMAERWGADYPAIASMFHKRPEVPLAISTDVENPVESGSPSGLSPQIVVNAGSGGLSPSASMLSVGRTRPMSMLPVGGANEARRARPISVYDPTKTFDSILTGSPPPPMPSLPSPEEQKK